MSALFKADKLRDSARHNANAENGNDACGEVICFAWVEAGPCAITTNSRIDLTGQLPICVRHPIPAHGQKDFTAHD